MLTNYLIVRMLNRRDFQLLIDFNTKLNKQFKQLITNVKREIIS